jgi:hypothetical protein
MIPPYIIAKGIIALLAGFVGVIILRDVGRSERRGAPASGLIRQLMLISFPGTDEKRSPYVGATFIGILLLAIALIGIATALIKLNSQ